MEPRTLFSAEDRAPVILTPKDVSDRLAAALRPRAPVPDHPVVCGEGESGPAAAANRPLTPAAVLVPLVERRQEVTVLLTRRTDRLAEHAGQISFPGGHIEARDKNAQATALREAEEEIGLGRRHVRILGQLEDHATGTGFLVTPVVAMVTPPFELSPDPVEVAEVFEVPLDFVLDPANHGRVTGMRGGRKRRFYALPFEGRFIWGFTAQILVRLSQLLRD